MLRQSIRLVKDNLKRGELVWREKYLSPDLSFVSGVTNQDYHLDKMDYIPYSIGNSTNSSVLLVDSKNVTREGYVLIKKKKYPVQTGKIHLYLNDKDIEYKYVDINGIIYYIHMSPTVTIHNWLKFDSETNQVIEDDVEGSVEGDYFYIDTIVWIEDGTVTIDGFTYFYDKYYLKDGKYGGLKYFENGDILEAKEITEAKDENDFIEYNQYNNVNDYQYVTKFELRQSAQRMLEFDRLSFCTYFYYVKVKNNYCPITLEGNQYKCSVLKRLLNPMEEDSVEYFETEKMDVKYSNNDGEDVNVTTEIIDRLSRLKEIESFIVIENTKLPVDYLVQNSNYGDELAIYLSNDTENITVGEILTIENREDDVVTTNVHVMDNEVFVLYNNRKYAVQERLCDKVVINEAEYPISYINGIEDDKDALVLIGDEQVPMTISGGTKQLVRYGDVVTADDEGNQKTKIEKYDINEYSGVTIRGNNYVVTEESNGKISVVEDIIPYTFTVNRIEGTSLLICTPNFNAYEFNDDFRYKMNSSICSYFVENQRAVVVYAKDRSFGINEITSDIGYMGGNEEPDTSNDYYDLFNNLILYVDASYIHIPLRLGVQKLATNLLQDNIIENDFYRVEKEKAINPIVDMEKDVYVPKNMPNLYSGRNTVFYPISEIEFNLHFRTRNLDNWKVNEGYNDVEMQTLYDNWFVTDYFPYSKMPPATSGDVLMNTSDLLGLLNFTNDDVFYQRDKIAKSFLRLSYYDSTDPQTQSLLATSTVFMDEHKLYKKFIDYSRKNVNDFGMIDISGDSSSQFDRVNRIRVKAEYIGEHDKTKDKYQYTDVKAAELSGDTMRISSRLVVNNKFETESSSEGFYLYIFKEYSEKLHPKPIYMKVEFNHAGIGRTIPFIIPMKWKDDDTSDRNGIGRKIPDRRYTLKTPADVTEMKKGYPLSYVYAQTYIPLYAVYDFQHKEYSYVFDNRYVTVDDEGRIRFNLFELKVADESSDSVTKQIQQNIAMGRAERAVINVNTNQFSKNAFNEKYTK